MVELSGMLDYTKILFHEYNIKEMKTVTYFLSNIGQASMWERVMKTVDYRKDWIIHNMVNEHALKNVGMASRGMTK